MTDSSTTIRGRSALVVGAGSGIGRAVALLLAQRGVATAAADLDTESVQRLSKEHPNVVALGGEPWDATDPTACDEMVTAAFSELGHLDQVITTVGWTAITPFLDESPEYWRRIVDINLMSAIYVSAAAGRLMKEHGGGSIVLTSS